MRKLTSRSAAVAAVVATLALAPLAGVASAHAPAGARDGNGDITRCLKQGTQEICHQDSLLDSIRLLGLNVV